MKQQLQTRLYASCAVAGCSGEWRIEHIRVGETVHWSCHVCGTPHDQKRLDADHVEVTIADRPMRRRKLVLLEVVPTTEPIRFVVSTEWDDDHDHQAYYYDEGTCPVNWIDDVVHIQVGDDHDPHGFARFVAMVDDAAAGDDYHRRRDGAARVLAAGTPAPAPTTLGEQ